MNRRWGRFAPDVHAQRVRLAWLVGIGIVTVGLQALLPWPLKLIIDQVLGGQPMPATLSWFSSVPGAASTGGLLAWLVMVLLLLSAGVMAMQLVKGVLQADLSARLRLAVGARVFERLQALSLTYHRRHQKGDLIRRVTSDSNCLPSLVIDVALPILTSLLSLTVLFLIMWQLDRTLALLAIFVALPMALLMRLLAPRMTERAYKHQQAEGAVWSVAEQTLTAIPVVQAFGREELEGSRFKGVTASTIKAYIRTVSSQLQFRVGIDGIEAVGIAAIMLIGGLKVVGGTISVGTLVVFLSYLTALYAPLLTFAYLATTVANAAASARRVAEVLDCSEMVCDMPVAVALTRPCSRDVAGRIDFEQVVFGYQSERPVLHDLSLQIRAGETLALVGRSGAGKSTLVSLIPRLYDPWQGRVAIDGQDLRRATLDSVRQQVAFVLQDPFLLPVSVADNIAYGRPAASRGEIEAAAHLADAHGFIEQMPRGYDTVIGERGITLSGGQRQRIAIARALLKDTPILIMDEPTSAVDSVTEHHVLGAVRRLAEGRTTIIIAHRLSTVRMADRIAVLDDGRVSATGSHDTLSTNSMTYRALFTSQLVSAAGAAAPFANGTG
ncbi:ABC transporter ATP-binding protein [Piscinibacter sakaiensis]|uniref:ABC transporter ATP-binding protein n=1 Tax=Piscinibacter sakaiensis TaxID=1547922 RepID=UPI003AAB7F99